MEVSELLRCSVISIITGKNLGRVVNVVLDNNMQITHIEVGLAPKVEIPINKVVSVVSTKKVIYVACV